MLGRGLGVRKGYPCHCQLRLDASWHTVGGGDVAVCDVIVMSLPLYPWPILSALSVQLEDFIPDCEEFYKKKHNGRKLYWHHIMSNGVVSEWEDGEFPPVERVWSDHLPVVNGGWGIPSGWGCGLIISPWWQMDGWGIPFNWEGVIWPCPWNSVQLRVWSDHAPYSLYSRLCSRMLWGSTNWRSRPFRWLSCLLGTKDQMTKSPSTAYGIS